MSDTPQLKLPLLASAQAQKHVTVNEALVRLDTMAQPVALTVDYTSPPTAADGDAYIVAAGAMDAWAGYDTHLAVYDNGGWIFLTPREGWRVWIVDRREYATFAGGEWVIGLAGGIVQGAYGAFHTQSTDQAVSGTSVVSTLTMPNRAVVIGVTARVIVPVSGAGVTGWRIGVAGSDDRYGKEIGLALNASSNGVSGAPVAYFENTPLLLSAEGGSFDSGEIRLAIHYFLLTPPAAI